MRAYRRSLALLLWFSVGAAVLAGCADAQKDPPGGVRATFTYGCCSAADLAQVSHPGGVVRLHWIVSPGPPSPSGRPLPVILSASLAGAYGDAADLKSSVGHGEAPSSTSTASPVQTTSQAGGAPVTTIAIPPDAAPGLYDLTTVVESVGGKSTGDHIIRIEPIATS